MSQYTPEQLAEILELHSKWRVTGGSSGSSADLYGADLYGANLSSANLSGADLSRANLSGADLSGADLSGANLSRANLSRAYLSRAYLSSANLSRANLSGADLSGADLSGADLYGADHILRGPCLDGHEVFLVRFEDGPRYKAGCRWFSVAQAKEHWNNPEHGGGRKHCVLMLTGLAGLLEVAHLLGWEGCAP